MANEHVENYTNEDNESIAGNTSSDSMEDEAWTAQFDDDGTSLDKAFCGLSLLYWFDRMYSNIYKSQRRP